MSSEIFSHAEPEPGLYPSRWTPLKEWKKQLKENWKAHEEKIPLYKRKAAAWKGVHVKKAKTASNAHAIREDSSDAMTSWNLKGYEGGSLF